MTDPIVPRSDDSQSVLHRLREELEAAAAEPALPDEPTAAERWAEHVLARAEIDYPAVVVAAADELIRPMDVSPDARQRFMAAAERALARRRADRGLLPVALAAARERAGLRIEDVAAQLDVVDLGDLEAGRTSILTIQPRVVAAWVHAVRADRRVAVDAARRSVQVLPREELQLAAGADPVVQSPDAWIADFEAALDALDGGTTGVR